MELTPSGRLAPWRAAGQAVRGVALQCGRWTHRLVRLAVAVLLVAVVGLGALSLRLTQGPLPLGWLARRIVAQVNADDPAAHLSIGRAAIAWQGMRVGFDSPIELVLQDISLGDPQGQSLHLPRAAITLAPRPLLQGRIVVRAASLDGLRVRVERAAEGTTRLDVGGLAATGDTAGGAPPVAALLAALAAAPSEARGPGAVIAALRRLRIRDSVVSVDDRQLGLAWSADVADITLDRASGGGASGVARLDLRAGASDRLHLDARVALLPGGGLAVSGRLDPLVPARLAGLMPALAPLTALDLPLTLSGTLTLDRALALQDATLSADVGTGLLHLGQGHMPIQDAALSASLAQGEVHLALRRLHLQARPDAPLTTVDAEISGTLQSGRLLASATIDLDQAEFADLPTLWPEGIGGPGTRPWVIENLTGGLAHNAHVSLDLTAPADLSDATVTRIEGGLEASDVTCWWLRPAPPITHGAAKLVFVDPDTIDVLVSAGQETGTGLAVRDARLRLTGIAGNDQFMAIDANLAGPFADVVGLLHHRAIRILDKLAVPIEHPAGRVATNLTVTMPLKTDLTFDNVAIHAHGHLADGHLGGTAAGHDLDQAQLDVDVSNDGLRVQGTASVLGLVPSLDVTMNFRGGPQSQVVQRVAANAAVTPAALARLGLDTQGLFTGSAAIGLILTEQRGGAGVVSVQADLQQADLEAKRLNWHKPPGTRGQAALQLRLAHDHLVAIDQLRVDTPDLQLAADGETRGGRVSLLRVQQLVIGSGTSLAGEVTLPARDTDAIRVRVSGPRLDLSAALDRRAAPAAPDAPDTPETRGRPYEIEAQIGTVATGHGQSLTQVTASLENDGLVVHSANLRAVAGAGAFTLALAPQPGGRHLTGTSADAGALLRALDVLPDMQGGTMLLDARYDDTKPGRPLVGTATITDFRIRNAPAIGRLLQAMSLYGLVEVAQGPGLGFDQLVAPFTLRHQVLTLADARAFSASLGMTAKGSIDLAHKTAAIAGTIVPAYFFNTLPGKLPLLGRLFSPETGGGLFAASYAITGPADDPSVSVNPLSVLTPGFLRGFFDLFDAPAAGGQKVPVQRNNEGGR